MEIILAFHFAGHSMRDHWETCDIIKLRLPNESNIIYLIIASPEKEWNQISQEKIPEAK